VSRKYPVRRRATAVILISLLLASCSATGTTGSIAPRIEAEQADGLVVTVSLEQELSMARSGVSVVPPAFTVAGSSQTVTRHPVNDGHSWHLPVIGRRAGFVVIKDMPTDRSQPTVGTAVYIPVDGSPSVELGQATHVLASPDLTRVWLYVDESTPRQRDAAAGPVSSRRSIVEVDVGGNVVSPLKMVASNRTPVGALNDGVIMTKAGSTSTYEVWDPRTDTVLRTLDVRGSIAVDGGRYVVKSGYSSACSMVCSLDIADVSTNATYTVLPEPGASIRGWDISPDGSRIAVIERSGGLSPTVVRVHDLAGQAVVARDEHRVTNERTVVAWSPSSRWLYVSSDERTVVAYRPGDVASSLQRIRIDNNGSFVVVG
jgi:hypothetical protein